MEEEEIVYKDISWCLLVKGHRPLLNNLRSCIKLIRYRIETNKCIQTVRVSHIVQTVCLLNVSATHTAIFMEVHYKKL